VNCWNDMLIIGFAVILPQFCLSQIIIGPFSFPVIAPQIIQRDNFRKVGCKQSDLYSSPICLVTQRFPAAPPTLTAHSSVQITFSQSLIVQEACSRAYCKRRCLAASDNLLILVFYYNIYIYTYQDFFTATRRP
jgi:hypothetical protein